jgi:hypothetical protein
MRFQTKTESSRHLGASYAGKFATGRALKQLMQPYKSLICGDLTGEAQET